MNPDHPPTTRPDTLLEHVTRYFLVADEPMLASRWMRTGGDTAEAQRIIQRAERNACIALAALKSFPGSDST